MSRGTLLLLAIVFASGLASGFFVGRSSITAPPRGRLAVTDEILRETDATPEQRAAIERIIERNHPRYAEVRARVEPELAALRSETRTQIRSALDPERAARFDDWCRRRDEQRAQEH